MSSRKQLEQIFELIQQEELEEANNLLQPILEAEPNNADAWWLMANTVDDPRRARRALVNVLKNDPQHSKARELLDVLNERYPPRDDELEMLMELEDQLDDDTDFWQSEDEPLSDEELFEMFEQDTSVDLSKLDDDLEAISPDDDMVADDDLLTDDEDPFADLLAEDDAAAPDKAAEKKRRRWVTPLLIILLAAIAATVLIALQQGEEEDSEAVDDTGRPDLPQLVAVDNPDLTAVVDQATQDAQQHPGLSNGDSQVVLSTTNEGQTLFVQSCVCVRPESECDGPPISQLSTIIDAGFEVVVPYASESQIEAVGVDIRVCGGTDIIYRAYAAKDDVNAGQLLQDMAAFRDKWKVE